MPIYVLMTKLAPETEADPRGRRAVGREWKKLVDKAVPEVKFLAHYALLGPYDFMDIYEAPDEAAAHRVSLLSRERGALSAESWPAMPYEQYVKLAEELEKKIK
jgi:uncharacterized protein with GYD domain